MLPANQCIFAQSNYQSLHFVMTSTCRSNSVILGSVEQGIRLSKGQVAIVVVILDLIITWFAYIALLALKPLQEVTEIDVNGDSLSASNFTVVLSLDWFLHEERAENLQPILWAWAENVLRREKKDFVDHNTNTIDRN